MSFRRWNPVLWGLESHCHYLTNLCKTRNAARGAVQNPTVPFTNPATSPVYLKRQVCILKVRGSDFKLKVIRSVFASIFLCVLLYMRYSMHGVFHL